MAGNSFGWLTYDAAGTDTFTVAGGSSRIVDVDLFKDVEVQFLVEGTYTTTASSTGLDIEVFYGVGRGDPDATGKFILCVLDGADSNTNFFSDNSDSVSTATYTASTTNETKRTFFSLNNINELVPRWCRIKIINNDAINTITIKIYTDL